MMEWFKQHFLISGTIYMGFLIVMTMIIFCYFIPDDARAVYKQCPTFAFGQPRYFLSH